MKPKAPYAKCDQCPLRNEPFVGGEGPLDASEAFVGFAPGREEVKKGRPFIGPSGALVDAALDEFNADRRTLRITNAVLCQTPKNREPTEEELECCAPRLAHEIQHAHKVLALGKVPRDVLIPEMQDEAVGSTRGRWFASNGQHVLPTYHPAFTLRGNPDSFREILWDVKKFFYFSPQDVPDIRYRVLQNLGELELAVSAALKSGKPLSVDAETSNRNRKNSTPELWWQGFILCLGFHWLPKKAFIVPEEMFHSRKALEILYPLFENPQGIYGHNIKYDADYIKFYYDVLKDPISIYLCDDTYVMHSLLDERKGVHGLKPCAQYYFDAPDYEREIHKYLGKPKTESYANVPREVLHKYLAFDVHYSAVLREQLIKDLKEEELYETPYRMILVPALNTVSRAQHQGMPVNLDKMHGVAEYMDGEVQELRKKLKQYALEGDPKKTSFNPNSPQQVARVMYDDIGLKQPKSGNKIKNRSTNKLVLEMLKGKHPFVDALKSYRRWAKLHSTYASKIPNRVDPKGFAHYSFNLAGAETGRISGELLLTIPRKYTPEGKMIRDAFEAPKGWKILAADFSQAELRWGTWYSQDEVLRKVYEEDRDLHSEVAIELFGPAFTKEQRMHTKMLNFSFLYGGSEYSLAEDTGMPVEKARVVVRGYKEKMFGLSEWREATWREVKEKGYLITPVRRMRRFPLITRMNWHSIRTESVNFRVQSISSDCTMWGFSMADEYYLEQKWDIIPILFMHDGVYFLIRDDEELIRLAGLKLREKLLWSATSIMENAGIRVPEYANLESVPFKVDLEVGRSWGELEKLDV